MFGMDFVHFFYEYCDRGCETDCYIDHACGNGMCILNVIHSERLPLPSSPYRTH